MNSLPNILSPLNLVKLALIAALLAVFYRVSEQFKGGTETEYLYALGLVSGCIIISQIPIWIARPKKTGFFLTLFLIGFFIRLLLILGGAVILSLFVIEHKLYFIFWVGLLYIMFLAFETFKCVKRIRRLNFAPENPFEKEENEICISDNESPRRGAL
ncbi:hypothetical protein STSP1_00502 [Sedimentisphaera salicampi]|uniref:Uncharacterized protein n=1 Tax=Sedimentisphaera salicampi TaxID=1941349 RepID=A0A1W6LK21_9BACT|nr:hypothetical protein STSP1_00502 [Sedimentisphaera salicampi]